MPDVEWWIQGYFYSFVFSRPERNTGTKRNDHLPVDPEELFPDHPFFYLFQRFRYRIHVTAGRMQKIMAVLPEKIADLFYADRGNLNGRIDLENLFDHGYALRMIGFPLRCAGFFLFLNCGQFFRLTADLPLLFLQQS